jgi:ABC-type Na+ efflux pump permease subunit
MSIFTSMLDVDYKHDQYEHDSEDEHTEALAKHISERIYAPTGDEGPYESEASVYGELASQSQAQAIQARSSSVVDVYGKPASQSQARAIQARIQVVEHECRARMHSRC